MLEKKTEEIELLVTVLYELRMNIQNIPPKSCENLVLKDKNGNRNLEFLKY